MGDPEDTALVQISYNQTGKRENVSVRAQHWRL